MSTAHNSQSSTPPVILQQSNTFWTYTRGILTGVASGTTKLVIGHPFDTIKVRMQVDGAARFQAGVVDCLRQTVRKEGFTALYKGATPPLIGWGIIDSILWSSLVYYRGLLHQYNQKHYNHIHHNTHTDTQIPLEPLSLTASNYNDISILQHGIAGLFAGWTSCIVVVPIEQVKARLQIQYNDPSTKLYKGPIDCVRKLIQQNGVLGLYKGLAGTIMFRTCMSYYFASFELYKRWLSQYDPTYKNTQQLSMPANFTAGVMAALTLWTTSYPTDVIKNKCMSGRYNTVRDCIRQTFQKEGLKGFYRGFIPGVMRAIPVNGSSLVVTEYMLKHLPT